MFETSSSYLLDPQSSILIWGCHPGCHPVLCQPSLTLMKGFNCRLWRNNTFDALGVQNRCFTLQVWCTCRFHSCYHWVMRLMPAFGVLNCVSYQCMWWESRIEDWILGRHNQSTTEIQSVGPRALLDFETLCQVIFELVFNA